MTGSKDVSATQAAAAAVRGGADPAMQSQFDTILAACTFENVSTGQTLVRTPGQPFTYGDDAELDALWNLCASIRAPTSATSCSTDPPRVRSTRPSPTVAVVAGCRWPARLVHPGTNRASRRTRTRRTTATTPPWTRLWDQCAGGDGQACTALVFQAPVGSAYAEFGRSCGNRPDDPNCPASG